MSPLLSKGKSIWREGYVEQAGTVRMSKRLTIQHVKKWVGPPCRKCRVDWICVFDVSYRETGFSLALT